MSSLSERVSRLGALMHEIIVTASSFEKEQEAAAEKVAQLAGKVSEVERVEKVLAQKNAELATAEGRLADAAASFKALQKKLQ